MSVTTNLNDLATFVRVAELGTISAAARAEGVPKSTISRRVARLEDELGVALLRRSARSFTLTDEGQSLRARAVGAVRELESAATALVELPNEPSGRLVVTVPADLATASVVVDLLVEYRERHPAVELEVRLMDRFVDLVAEEVDVALRVHPSATVPGDDALIARSLGVMRAALYAAPSYLERNPAPSTPQELAHHAYVAHSIFAGRQMTLNQGDDDDPKDDHVKDDGHDILDFSSTIFTGNSMHLVCAMVQRGIGVGPLPKFVAEAAMQQGQLVRLLPNWWLGAGRLTLLWPPSRHLAPRVRAFVDLATEKLTVSRWMCAE